jgi:hypothetical protein
MAIYSTLLFRLGLRTASYSSTQRSTSCTIPGRRDHQAKLQLEIPRVLGCGGSGSGQSTTLGRHCVGGCYPCLRICWDIEKRTGAFVGIAFAIVGLFAAECPGHANQTQRKLPWASTLQVSLTLALVNPVLWYLVDRSKPGFFLSAGVGVIGTTVLLSLNPEMMPSPLTSPSLSSQNGTSVLASQAFGDFLSQETIECGTWIISVLFCSCVCFGNIGRRLALKRGSTVRRDSLQ